MLDSLADKGYLSKTQKQKKLLYSAEKPETLLHTLRAKEETLREALPMLEAMMATAKERPKITIFEGKEGVWRVYTEIFASPEIIFFGSIKDILRCFPDLIASFKKIVKIKNQRVRDLLTTHRDDLTYARECVSETYEVRIVPLPLNFSIDCAIYGNKVAILAAKKDFFAVVVESQDVADSFRSLHALAWQSAKTLDELEKWV